MNGYYNGSTGSGISPYLRAKAEGVSAQFTAIAQAFDKIPADNLLSQNRLGYVVASGTGNAIIVALSPAPSVYAAGTTLKVKVLATNEGATTINLNGLGPKLVLTQDGEQLVAGDLRAGGVASLTYDGSSFRLDRGVFRPSGVISPIGFTLYDDGTWSVAGDILGEGVWG